jgi:hypothetical protein
VHIFLIEKKGRDELFDDRHENSYHQSQQAGRSIASKGQSKRFLPLAEQSVR